MTDQSIAGPRLAEVKVRHHSRQYGQSKYGLSRVYKVLLDLMTVKMIASFSTRPLYWFSLLSLPFLIISTIIVSGSVLSALFGGTMSLSIAGTGVIFFTLAVFLIVGGAIGELVYKTGTFDAALYPLLTAELDSNTDLPGELQFADKKGQLE